MKKTFLILILSLTLALFVSLRYGAGQKRERERLQTNQRTLLEESRSYRVRDSLNAATVGVLTLRADEFRRHFGELNALIRDMNVKLRRVESLSQNSLESRYDISARVRDTVIAPTAPVAPRSGVIAPVTSPSGTIAPVTSPSGTIAPVAPPSGATLVALTASTARIAPSALKIPTVPAAPVPAAPVPATPTTAAPVPTAPATVARDPAAPPHPAQTSAHAISYHDTYITLDGVIVDSIFRGTVITYDTLTQIVHRVPHRFLFIRWGTRELRQEIVSSNPHTRITYSRSLRLAK